MPCGGVVNDYVPFYFSPITAFCYTIHRGNVHLRSPDGQILGVARQEDRSFIVYKAADLLNNNDLTTYFSNTSLNNKSIDIVFGNSFDDIHNVVSWNLFDDQPLTAQINEIGYEGCCRFFKNSANPERYQDRSQRRMAEFLVRDAVPLSLACCIVSPHDDSKQSVENILSDHQIDIPVYVKPGCFF